MMKTKKSSKGLALVLAAVLALTPMAGFPLTALATGEAAAPKAEAPATDAGDAPAADAGETLQVDAPAADADANTNTTPGTTPSTPAVDAETLAADAGTNPEAAGSTTNPPAANVVTPDLTPTPTVDPDAANDGVVNEKDFPDANFWAYVQGKFDTKKDGILDTDEIKAATEINVNNQGIATLQGIEYFTALTNLDCCNYYGSSTPNQLTDLDVSKNTALYRLYCGGNQLTALDVSKNTALAWLGCNDNRLTTLNVSANIVLYYLGCHNNKLTTLDLSHNTALVNLSCENNQLTTLDLTEPKWVGGDFAYYARTISPQTHRIPVVKRGKSEYGLDLEALAKGKMITEVNIDGKPVDPKDCQKIHGAVPQSLQYKCETGSLNTAVQTMTVEAAGFDYSYLATLSADTHGNISCDVAPSASGEILLAENSTPTFTAAAALGYQIDTLKVGEKDIEVSKDATSQTLTLPPVTDAVSITATFKEIPAPIEPPVDPADPINPSTPPAVPDNGGNNNNNGGGTTTIVERTNTVFVPAAPQAAALVTPEAPATPATAAAKTEAAPAKATADTATPQDQLENPTLGAQGFDTQHSHLPLALLLLAVWLVGGFAVIRQRKHAHDAIEGTSF